MEKEKSRGDLSKIVKRETELEVPKTASEIKLQSVGAKLIEAWEKLAKENGEVLSTDRP